MPAWISRALPLWCVLHALPLGAQTLCSSAGVAPPHALFERFTRADCLACWQDPATPAPGASALVLDWLSMRALCHPAVALDARLCRLVTVSAVYVPYARLTVAMGAYPTDASAQPAAWVHLVP